MSVAPIVSWSNIFVLNIMKIRSIAKEKLGQNGSQRVNCNDFGVPLAFHLVPVRPMTGYLKTNYQ